MTSLPKGVRFNFGNEGAGFDAAMNTDTATDSGVGDSGAWKTVAVFLPDGTARDDVESRSQWEWGQSADQLRLRALTGTVKSVTGKENP